MHKGELTNVNPPRITTEPKGTVVVNYENAQSIELKCRFLHRQGMLGAMYWDYDSDDEMGTLRHAVYRGVMQLP